MSALDGIHGIGRGTGGSWKLGIVRKCLDSRNGSWLS